MQRHHSQFDRRKNAASPRRLALRFVKQDLSKDFFQRLAVSPNNSSELSEASGVGAKPAMQGHFKTGHLGGPGRNPYLSCFS